MTRQTGLKSRIRARGRMRMSRIWMAESVTAM